MSATSTVPITDSTAETKAACPEGKASVAGGFAAVKDGPPFVKVLRRAGDRGWKAGVDSLGPGDGELTAYAYCKRARNPLAKAETRSKTVELPAGPEEIEVLKARCPRGETPVSGGFSGPIGDGPYVFASRRRGRRTWIARYISFASEPVTARVQANCYDGPPLQARTKTRAIDPPNTQTDYGVTAKCPAGTRAVSGGFSSSYPFNKPGAFVHESRRTGSRTWTTRFSIAFVDLNFTTYVYCR